MKKKVVAAALICSVFGSSHATDNDKFDDYGGTYQGEVHRPVQRLDRFRRFGKKTSSSVENRFSNRKQSTNSYVINDQTGEKVYLDNVNAPVNYHSSPQFQPENNPSRDYETMHRSNQTQRTQKVAQNYESTRFEMDHSQSSNNEIASQYEFTGAANNHIDSEKWRSQGHTQGRFAAASSHRNKLDQVKNNHAQSWNQESARNVGWNNSVAQHSKQKNWQNPAHENFSRKSWNNVEPDQVRNAQTVEQALPLRKESFNQNVNRYNSENTRHAVNPENYAMDRRSFWPSRDQQTRHVTQNNNSIHHQTDDLPRADRRIQSRMEDPKEFDPNQRMVHSNRAQLQRADESQYQSLRRPRVRVDLRQNQSDRRKRQRRSWLPNPFRGVSRMFSGIFGRR